MAGGQSINELSEFNTACFVELSWSPSIDQQAILRMCRTDKDKELMVYYLICDDEHTWMVNQGKENYLKEVMDGWIIKYITTSSIIR